MTRPRRRLSLTEVAFLIGLLFAFSSPAFAECFTVTPKQFKSFRADAIFTGTFVKKEVVSRFSRGVDLLEPVTGDGEEALRDRTAFGLRLTFEVRHVWKGPAPKTAILYQVLNPDSPDHWKPNTEYLIFADRLSDEQRSSVFLQPDEEAHIVQNCSGAWRWTVDVERDVHRAFGRGRKPKSE